MSLNATFVNLLQKKHGVVNIKDYYLSKKKNIKDFHPFSFVGCVYKL